LVAGPEFSEKNPFVNNIESLHFFTAF